MNDQGRLPTGLVLQRTTPIFTEDTVPEGLLRTHRVADGVWGRLIVRSGALGFVFEDSNDETLTVTAGNSLVIAPGRLHHVIISGPVEFAVEFHRPTEP